MPTRDELIEQYANPPACRASACPLELFDVRVYPQIIGTTYVVWDASRIVPAALSTNLEAQIEVSRYGVSASNAWSIIRAYAANTGIWADTTKRLFGNQNDLYYRVAIRDSALNVYRSEPVASTFSVPRLMAPTYLEAIRRWEGRGGRGETNRGYLLKRIHYGAKCPDCRDRDGGQQLYTRCVTCYGTGWTGGYYQVPRCCYAEIGSVVKTRKTDENLGTTEPEPMSTLTLLALPKVHSGDIWVNFSNDQRWLLGDMTHATSIGSVDLTTTIAAARLEFTDIAYHFPVDFTI